MKLNVLKIAVMIFGLFVFSQSAVAQQEDKMKQRPDDEKRFQEMDTNQDGYVDLAEFKAFKPSLKEGEKGNKPEKGKRNKIDKAEKEKTIKGDEPENEEMEQGDKPTKEKMKKSDRAKKGDKKELDKTRKELKTPEERFAEMDKNGDQKLDLQEFMAKPEKMEKGKKDEMN